MTNNISSSLAGQNVQIPYEKIGTTADGQTKYRGSNGVEFRDSDIGNIKLRLEKLRDGEFLGQQEMNMLLAAHEIATIEEHYLRFRNLNRETALLLEKLGLSFIPDSHPELFRKGFKSRMEKALEDMDNGLIVE